MESLIIYDNNGKIYFQGKGSVETPEGIPFMMVVVPNGKFVERINTSVEPHVPILADLPRTEFDTINLKLEQAKADNLTTLEALAEVYEMLLTLQA